MTTQKNKLRYEDFKHSINVDALEEAIGFVPEYQRGANDVGYCVFPENHAHGDTTGKFAIEREERVYNCWACGGGSLLSLVMELHDLDVDDATRYLYQFCEADTRSDTEFVDDFMDAFRDTEKRIATLPYFNNRVLDRFGSPIPAEFLEERGISPDTAEKYVLRWAPDIKRPAPKNGRFADDEDYYGPGIVFPHYWQGRLVGWQTRWLDGARPEWVPKYTMTTDFPKETTIYGWDHCRTSEAVIVCESVPSVLFLASHGYAAVATFGSSVNDAQMRLLRRFPVVILAPDNDPAGRKWLGNLTNYLKRYTEVNWLPRIGDWDSGADIGDFAKMRYPESTLLAHLSQMYEPGLEIK